MKILYIISITFLIVFAAGCDEMQSQVMKPMTMPDDGGPTEDEVVTSVGTMKDPSMETNGSKDDEPGDSEEDPPAETETMEEDTSTETETMEEDISTETEATEEDTSTETEATEEDTSNVPQTPVATFVSATPASGDISVNESITIEFDNDPGEVTVDTWAVSGSGTSRTISGPFTVGSLTLSISWTNGNGSHTLNYNVEADEPQIPDAAFSSATPASGNISENETITIIFDNDPGEVTVNTWTVSGSGTSRTISGPFTVGSLTLSISWTNGNGSHTLNYNVEADEPQIPDAAFSSATPASENISENETITITFDNDPGEVTVSAGTVSGSGTSRTISGPFSEGSLTLSISWTNGDGSKTLNYNVEADAAFSSASPASGNISENDTITITFDNDPGEVTVNEGTVSGSGTSRTISGPFSVGSLTLSISWTNGDGSKTLNYNVEADAAFSSASPASGNISENDTITITFDNDPGGVTASHGTVSGSGTSRTISGSFPVGSLTLTISWTNGNGSKTLNYNVEADAAFSSASPASGNISENETITITFDNDPGEVTVNEGTVSGSGTSRTISGPFSVGSLTLTISWTNGNGSHMLSYIVEDSTPPQVSTSSTADGAVDVDPTTVSDSGITVTFNETIGSGELKLYKDDVDVGWTATISENTITITKGSGQELSHGTTYQIKGTVKDSADNEKQVSITFTTESAPMQLEPLARGEGLRIGVTAPTFSVNDSDGNTYSFDGNSGGSSNIVIVFYRYRG